MQPVKDEFFDFLSIFPRRDERVDIEKMIEQLEEYFKTYHSYFNLGRFLVKYELPVNIYAEKCQSGKITFYEGTYVSMPHIVSFDFLNHPVTFYAYPEESFEVRDIKKIEFFANYIYMRYACYKSAIFINQSEYYDNITGSLNCFGIVKEITERNYDVSKYACIYINLKKFKLINKRYGIDVGDNVLKQYYRELNELFEPDEFFGRAGNDNFVAFIKKEKIDLFIAHLDYMQIPIKVGDKTENYNVLYHAGVYFINPDDELSDAIDKANIACSTCKTLQESNVFFYTDDFAVKVSIEQQVLTLFNHAIENEEFVVFYQPKVNINSHRLCGAEALVRWKKDNNYISPVNFTPVLERENLIRELDLYMFEHVCKDIRNFLDAGLEPVKISVNLSRDNLRDKDIYDKIATCINKYEIDPKYIEIEITESSILEDKGVLRPFVDKLKRKGCSISVDDFGTGYSSLNFIKDYDFSAIKIDKSFIDSINTSNSKNLLFLKNILRLIKGLEMEIVAEGVENKIQENYLKNIGCDIIQGYLFDKPLTKEKFIKRLQDKQYK